jgi:signal transduction histidine kinase
MTTKPGGSGLGLPLVRLIAESHGGSIRYDDRPGGGASFTLTLPTQRAAA